MANAKTAPRFYSTRDLMSILSISRTKALEYMYQFEANGLVFRDGKTIRVDANAFDNYIKLYTRERS